MKGMAFDPSEVSRFPEGRTEGREVKEPTKKRRHRRHAKPGEKLLNDIFSDQSQTGIDLTVQES